MFILSPLSLNEKGRSTPYLIANIRNLTTNNHYHRLIPRIFSKAYCKKERKLYLCAVAQCYDMGVFPIRVSEMASRCAHLIRWKVII